MTSFRDALLRTTEDATAFWRGHRVTTDLVQQYVESGADPHRGWAVDAVLSFANVLGPGTMTVLEIGCHCGPLLERLAAAGVMAFGIDANADAIVGAAARGFSAGVGELPGCLDHGEPRMFDVVVSSYCLAYISPADLPRTIAGMLRIADRGIVIVEPMAGPGVASAVSVDEHYVEWRHDYLEAVDRAMALRRPEGLVKVELTRTAKGPHAGINGVVVGRCVWR